jgi:3-hydroxyisobutyrate dehydrogenase
MSLPIDKTTSIGFIGTGIMGASMAGHLLHNGYSVSIYNRTKEKANTLLMNGAQWKENPKKIALTCQVIFTMLGYPEDVKKVYLEPDGLILNAKPGAILIDMTSSSPSIAKEIAKAGLSRNISTLDAPVSGGDSGAKNGTLSIMVGGEKPTFENVMPLFKTFGKTIVYQGPAGSGQHTKLSNQILIASYMIGVCEAFQYAKKNGLNPETVLESVSGGAAGSWSLINLGPKMLRGDYEPGFYIHHFIKDLQIAKDECQQINLELNNLKNCLTLYGKLPDSFKKTKGTQAIYELFQ